MDPNTASSTTYVGELARGILNTQVSYRRSVQELWWLSKNASGEERDSFESSSPPPHLDLRVNRDTVNCITDNHFSWGTRSISDVLPVCRITACSACVGIPSTKHGNRNSFVARAISFMPLRAWLKESPMASNVYDWLEADSITS